MTIAEVGKKYGLSNDTLRYYERIGLLPSINRTPSGIRNYTQEDCKWIEFAKCMRGAGLPIDVLIAYLALFEQGDHTIEERKALLIKQRGELHARINEMQTILERLDKKIEGYEQRVIAKEKELKLPAQSV